MSAADLLAALLRTGLVLALAIGLDAYLRRMAAVRSFLLRAALAATVVAALLPPVLQNRVRPVVTLPAPEIAASVAPPPSLTPPSPTVASVPETRTPVRPASPTPSTPSPVAAVVSSPSLDLPSEWPLLLWGAGTFAIAAYWLLAHLAVVRLGRRGRSVTSGTAYAVLQAVAAEQGVPVPRLAVVPGLASPLACGVLRPTVLVPTDMAEREDRTELTAALAHEVAHLARRDVPWTYATRLVQALLWFQPLVWIVHRRMVAASEELCDLQAVQGGLRRETYADCLLRLAEAASRPRIEGVMGSRMATKRSSLSTRIEALLDARRVRSTRLSPRSRVAVTAGVSALAVGGGILVAAAPAVAQERDRPTAILPGTESAGCRLFKETMAKYATAKTLSFTVAGEESSGYGFRMNVRFQPPNRIWAELWERNGGSRARKLLVADGRKVTVFDEEEPTEVVVSLQDGTSFPDVLSQRGRFQLPIVLGFAAASASNWKRFEQALGKSEFGLSGPQRRTVVMRSNEYGRQTLALHLNDAGEVMEIASSYTTSGNKEYRRTEIYSNVKRDAPLDDSAFEFKVPKGAKVVAPFKPTIHQTPDALALAKRIEAAPKGLDGIAFEIEHVETIHRSGGDVTTSRTLRKVEYLRDGRARVEEDFPEDYGDVTLVSDGKTVTAVSTKSKGKVVRQPLDPLPYNRMRQLLVSGDFPAPRHGFGELIEMTNLGWASVYNLPRHSMELGTKNRIDSEPVEVLILRESFQKQNGAPTSGGIVSHVYVDAQGFIRRIEKTTEYPTGQRNEEVVEVRNLRLNPKLSPDRFRLDVPAQSVVLEAGNRDLDEQTESTQPIASLYPGEIPPSTSFTTIDGRTLNLPALKGKVVLLHAWTFGVTNYIEDLPRLEALHRKYAKDGLVVIAIAVSAGAPEREILKHIKEKGFTFTHVYDGPGHEGPLYKAWNLRSFPFQILIGRNGIVRGKNLVDDKLEENIKLALDE